MASFNRVILMGNMTRDPELRYTPGGTAVTEIGLAVNDRRKNQAGEWIEETTFVDVTLWGRTAEVACEYLNKGSPLLIEGRLKLDTWEKEGKKNSKLKVIGESMQMLGGRGGAGQGGATGGGAARSSAPARSRAAPGGGGQRPQYDDYSQSTPDAGSYDAGNSYDEGGQGGQTGHGPSDDIPF